MVEGAPWNCRGRGFDPSAKYGIVARPNIHLPHVDCLTVKELTPGGLINSKRD